MSLAARKGCHLYQARKGRGALLGAAIRKHGAESFVWEKLKDLSSLKEACFEERKLIAKLSPRYNQQEGGKKDFTPHNKGKKASKELCAKISAAAKTRVRTKRGSYSEVHKAKIGSKTLQRTERAFVCHENGKTYLNKVIAAKELGISPAGISLVLMPTTRLKSYKGFTFSYIAQDKSSLIDLEAR